MVKIFDFLRFISSLAALSFESFPLSWDYLVSLDDSRSKLNFSGSIQLNIDFFSCKWYDNEVCEYRILLYRNRIEVNGGRNG